MKTSQTLLLSLWVLGTAPAADPSEIVLEEGTNFAVALSPDGTQLVMDLQGTLWMLPSSGGEAQALTDGMGDDRLPDWSPEGDRIVFQSYRHGQWDIWTIASDGTDPIALTEGPFDDREPVYSPDGRRIAFSSDRSGNYDLWLLELDSGSLIQLTRSAGNDFMPSFSPDGAALAFISERGEDGSPELWKHDLESGVEEKIASFSGRPSSPSWSPDGERIVLRVLESREVILMGFPIREGSQSNLVAVPAVGGEPVRLTRGEDVFPFRAQWGPDGVLFYTSDGRIRRMAFKGSAETLEPIPFRAVVHLEPRSYERRKARILDPGGRFPARGIVRPVLSPDGAQIAFTALGDIWLAPAEGGEPLPFTRDEYLDADPSWSPDGQRLVFASDRAGTMDLWLKEIGSSPRSGEVRLTDLPGAEIAPAWSPTGDSIAYLDQENHLYVVALDGSSPRLVHRTTRWAGMPTWSADGRRIALAVHEPYSTRFREGANRILTVDVATGEGQRLPIPARSFGTRDGDGPVWSPDGKWMAFAIDGGLSVLPVGPDGAPAGAMRRVVEGAVDFPSWSPDSKSLLYLASDRLERVAIATGERSEIPVRLEYRVPRAAGKMVIRNVRLIDGTGAPPRESVDIVIGGNRIERIEPAGTVAIGDERVVEAKGKTAIPGLIEMHAHLGLPAWGSRSGRAWLAFGITSLRSPSAPLYRILEEKESILAGRRLGPRIFHTGYLLDGGRIYYTGSLAVDDEAELDRELERAFALDYDMIKTYVRLPDALQKRVVEEAHRRGVFVSSHEIYPAVAFGVDGIEHVSGTSRRGFSPKLTELRRSYGDVVELVSRSGVFLTPTLLIQGGYSLARAREPDLLEDERLAALFPPWEVENLPDPPASSEAERAEVVRPLFATVASIFERGGRIVAGTDAPIVPYGLGLVLEVEQLSEAGLGPLAAIRSATQVAAQALGAEEDLGTIEPGKLADIVILGGDPLEEIRNLRRVEQVILDGRLVSRQRLLQLPATNAAH